MTQIPTDIASARVLISNDDGISSKGIQVLEDCVSSLGAKSIIVAPESEQSAAGHSLTIHRPLRVKKYDDTHFSILGTPTDCVVMGIQDIMKDNKPDLVVSGINHGKNAGDDVTYSGTIAVAIEAALMGYPSIAFSQHVGYDQGEIDWSLSREYIPDVLKKLQGFNIGTNALINVNIPLYGQEPKGIIVVPQGHYEPTGDDLIACMDPRGRQYFWIAPPKEQNQTGYTHDTSALEDGYITITPLTLNLTHWDVLDSLKEKLNT